MTTDERRVLLAVLTVVLAASILSLAIGRNRRLRADRSADAMSGLHEGLDALTRIDQRHHH